MSCAEKPRCVLTPPSIQVNSIGFKSFTKSKPKSVVSIFSLRVTSEVCIVPFVAKTSSHLRVEPPKSYVLSGDGLISS